MSGAQIAHYLKVVGNGKEAAGIIAVYHAGWLVGIRQTLMVINAGYGAYLLGKWGYKKLTEYIQENETIPAAGELI